MASDLFITYPTNNWFRIFFEVQLCMILLLYYYFNTNIKFLHILSTIIAENTNNLKVRYFCYLKLKDLGGVFSTPSGLLVRKGIGTLFFCTKLFRIQILVGQKNPDIICSSVKFIGVFQFLDRICQTIYNSLPLLVDPWRRSFQLLLRLR